MSIIEKINQELSITKQNCALKYFIDRYELIKRFAEYLNDNPSKNKILYFYGDGGNGKSLLLKFLSKKGCKLFPLSVWKSLKNKSSFEVSQFIKNKTDWECDFKLIPSIILDFDEPYTESYHTQDPFYGLLMIRREIENSAQKKGYKLFFPVYDFACLQYLKSKGKLSNEQISKILPSTELFLTGGLINTLKELGVIATIPFSFAPSLAANIFSIITKYAGNLQFYCCRQKVQKEHLEKIMQLDPDKALIHLLPGLLADELNSSMQKADAPPRLALLFDTHEAFWGDWRNRGQTRFFKQDEWLRAFLKQLDLSTGIVVVVAGREIPRWHEASEWAIHQDKLETQKLRNFPIEEAQNYLEKVGIELTWRNALIQCAQIDKNLVHPLSLGLETDVFFALQSQGQLPKPQELPSNPQMQEKIEGLVEILLKYVDEETRDATHVLSACREFNQELYFTLAQALHLNPTITAFRTLTRFSFVWPVNQINQGWYRIHPYICRLNHKNNQEMTLAAHQFLEKYYSQQDNMFETIYHIYWQDPERAISQWLQVFERAKQKEEQTLCLMLEKLKTELGF